MNFKLSLKKIFIALLLLLVLFPKISFASLDASKLVYTPMEEIPGFGKPISYGEYITAIYKFGLWTVGISAVLMISIGAFWYITSAGNANTAGKAKGVIVDALIGVFLAMISYILLYTINPNLLNITLPDMINGGVTNGIGGGGVGGGGSAAGSGKCEKMTTGPCSVDNLKNTCFGANAEQASAICSAESGGNSDLFSGVDKCQPGGESISWGLFQINLSANNLPGGSCSQKTCATSAAVPMYTGSNKNCTIQSNYNACVTSAKNASCNIETACSLSGNGTHWGKWGANKKCGFPN